MTIRPPGTDGVAIHVFCHVGPPVRTVQWRRVRAGPRAWEMRTRKVAQMKLVNESSLRRSVHAIECLIGLFFFRLRLGFCCVRSFPPNNNGSLSVDQSTHCTLSRLVCWPADMGPSIYPSMNANLALNISGDLATTLRAQTHTTTTPPPFSTLQQTQCRQVPISANTNQSQV